MTLYLFEDEHAREFEPLTLTRPLWDLRVGILTLLEKVEHDLPQGITAAKGLAGGYLAPLFNQYQAGGDAVFLNAAYAHHTTTRQAILSQLVPVPSCILHDQGRIVAFRTREPMALSERYLATEHLPTGLAPLAFFEDELKPLRADLQRVWDILGVLKIAIDTDYHSLVHHSSTSHPIADPYTRVYNPAKVFAGEGVKTYAAILNAEEGPIYLGAGATLEEGASLRGPCAVLAGATVSMGAKIRPGTVIGPKCKVGGEVSNSLFWGYSNKAHDGFVGDSLIGQWCNLGADTNTSNLRNNYAPVRLYSRVRHHTEDTGQTFIGLIMGDHAKSGINTMFNTGTTVGVGANVFGGGFPPKHVPDFSWGMDGTERYDFLKFCETAARVMQRRQVTFSAADRALLAHIYAQV